MITPTKYIDYEVYDFLKDEFFVKWARGIDPQLSDFWDKWISEHPEKADTVAEAKGIVQAFDYKKSVTLSDDEYINLYEGILKKNGTRESLPGHFTKIFYRVAAAVSLLIVSYFLWTTAQNETEDAITNEVIVTKSTNLGEKLTVRLSDGSMVRMNAGSQIHYKEHFEESMREIHLSGEAFFEVARDENRPFIVITEKMSVEALGTSFNVNSYDEDDNVITLVTGKVGVSTLDRLYTEILRPGQQAHVGSNPEILVSSVELAEILEWTRGVLSFRETNFEDVIVSLERWYGVSISIKGSIPPLEAFSGRFENENLKNILDVMAYSSGFTYTIDEKNVEIKF